MLLLTILRQQAANDISSVWPQLLPAAGTIAADVHSTWAHVLHISLASCHKDWQPAAVRAVRLIAGLCPCTEGEQRRRGSRKQEKTAVKWYGGLDRRPLAKASGAAPSRQRSQAEHSRLASAFAAYADLDGPKH